MFHITMGCEKTVLQNGSINNTGLFEVFKQTEPFRKVKKHIIIPAKDNTACSCRRTSVCNQACPNAVYAILGTTISYRKEGKRI